MNRRLACGWGLLVCLWIPVTGQAPAVEEGHKIQTPSWLALGVEMRSRLESVDLFDSDASARTFLSRLRLNVAVKPTDWLRFVFQGQDSRAFDVHAQEERRELRNTFDARQVYAEFGRAEQGWQLRMGRQEIALGDERLMGAETYTDCFAQSFDAMRGGFIGKRFRVDTFTGFLVRRVHEWPDPLDTGDRISGLSVQWKTRGEGVVEPYLLWKRGDVTQNLLGAAGHRDVVTPGIRAAGDLPQNLDYNVEMALQRGHIVADRLSAWAGHWALGWKPLGREVGPRIGLEYNFASGDRNPADGTHGTFDDLYPSGFDDHGMPDPVAWRNIRYPAIGVEMPLSKRWTLRGSYRHYSLANSGDGFYTGGDRYMVRTPAATDTQVGSLAYVSAAYRHSARWQLYGGYGYVFPGAYLRQSGYGTNLRTAYLLYSFTY